MGEAGADRRPSRKDGDLRLDVEGLEGDDLSFDFFFKPNRTMMRAVS